MKMGNKTPGRESKQAVRWVEQDIFWSQFTVSIQDTICCKLYILLFATFDIYASKFVSDVSVREKHCILHPASCDLRLPRIPIPPTICGIKSRYFYFFKWLDHDMAFKQSSTIRLKSPFHGPLQTLQLSLETF